MNSRWAIVLVAAGLFAGCGHGHAPGATPSTTTARDRVMACQAAQAYNEVVRRLDAGAISNEEAAAGLRQVQNGLIDLEHQVHTELASGLLERVVVPAEQAIGRLRLVLGEIFPGRDRIHAAGVDASAAVTTLSTETC